MRRHPVGVSGIVLVLIAVAGVAITAVVVVRSPSTIYVSPFGTMGGRGDLPQWRMNDTGTSALVAHLKELR